MRPFVVLMLSIGCALALPQGYNYQIEVGPSGGSSVEAIPNQYQQIIQQISPQIAIQQQQLPQIVYQEQFAGQIPQISQGFSVDQSGPQYAQNLLQNAQEVIQFQQQQQQHHHQHQEQQQIQLPATAVEAPQAETIHHNEPTSVAQAAIEDSQPQFIIKSRNPETRDNFQSVPASAEKKVTFQKEFYYLSAPPEEYEAPSDLDQQLATLKKNLRVVFIRAPENNGLENAALQLAKQAANAQTAIYVLNKQHDVSELAQKLNSVQSTPQRPEVAFIKYRTPEEAEHAQRVIQAQYESLEGTNHINRPDVGVSHNFVGSTTGNINPRTSTHGSSGENVEISKPPSKYLPSKALKH